MICEHPLWHLDTPDGDFVKAVCQKCGAEKMMAATLTGCQGRPSWNARHPMVDRPIGHLIASGRDYGGGSTAKRMRRRP